MTCPQTHLLNDLNARLNSPTNMKATIFYKNENTSIIISDPNITPEECKENLKHIHTNITSQYFSSRKNSKVINATPYDIHSSNKYYHVICIQNWHS